MFLWFRHIFIILLVPVFVHLQAFAQNAAPGYTVKKWTTEDGLTKSQLSDIWKTSDGYMWLQSLEGLIRFDGKNFTPFSNANNPVFSSVSRSGFSENGSDEFWLNNASGESTRLIRYKNGLFEYIPFFDDSYTRLNRIIPFFELDQQGVLWIGGNDGLYAYENNRFVQRYGDHIQDKVIGVVLGDSMLVAVTEQGFYQVKNDHVEFFEYDVKDIITLTLDQHNTIWFGTQDELYAIQNGQIKPYDYSSISNKLLFFRKLRVRNLNTDVVYFFSSLATYKLENGVIREIQSGSTIEKGEINHLTELTQDLQKGWLRTGNTLWHNNTLIFDAFNINEDRPRNSPLFIDENEQAWVASDDGLYLFRTSLFTSYNASSGIQNVYPLYEDSEHAIWAGDREGMIYRVKDNKVQSFGDPSFARVLSFYEDSERNLWMGTGRDIKVWNRKTETITPVATPFNRTGLAIKVMQKKDEEHVFIGSREGLHEYNITTNTWNSIPVEGDLNISVEQLHITNDHSVWLGSRRHGLFTLRNDSLVAFFDNDGLSDVRIRSIYQDDEGILWVGMNGGGLNRIALNKDGLSAKSITKYSPDNGLFGSTIHAILEDNYGRFWMSSNQGIFWVTKQQLNELALGNIDRINPVVYQKEDGLPGNEANGAAQYSGLIAKDGTFWFAMLDGITSINPEALDRSRGSFPTRFESFSTADSTWYSFDDELTIPKGNRSISINYTANNFTVKGEDVRFSYTLEGITDDWVYAGSERAATFNNLSAGSNDFKIRSGMGGNWDESNISTLSFTVEPYFYETSWFLSLCVILGGSLFIGLIIWGNRRLQFQRKQYEVTVREQEDAISENAEFLNGFKNYVEERINETSIKVSEIASVLNTSERQLYRTTKTLTGFTPHQFVREIRLLKAKQILDNQQASTISEVAHAVGFSTPFYFSKLFEERFQVHPGTLI